MPYQMMFAIAIAQFILCALLFGTMRPFARKRLWVSRVFIIGQTLIVVMIWGGRLVPVSEAGFVQPKIDRSSLVARFSSISMEGPQRQLVFHYTLENVSGTALRVDSHACAAVSFRFLQKKPALTAPTPNPALDRLEKDDAAYTEFTGLVRLPVSQHALSLDQCPLELQPKEGREVAIAIPYAFPATEGNHPTQNDLVKYVRTYLPQVDGFGLSGLERNYEIIFPRAW